MRPSAAARRYARALFGLAQEASSVPTVRGELERLATLLEATPELRQALFRPLYPVEERSRVLASVCTQLSASELLRHFSAFLIDQRRIVDFDAICQEYARLADEAEGRTKAKVVSASPLSDAQRERLQRALAARTGREVELDVYLDPSLLGGAIASVGTLVIDGSLKTQLAQLRTSLMKGN